MYSTYYNIEYHNRALKESHTIRVSSLNEAIKTAKSIKSLTEMENVKLNEVREIDFDGIKSEKQLTKLTPPPPPKGPEPRTISIINL